MINCHVLIITAGHNLDLAMCMMTCGYSNNTVTRMEVIQDVLTPGPAVPHCMI